MTARRPSLWYLWVPLLVVALVVVAALLRPTSVQEAPAAAPTVSATMAPGASTPRAPSPRTPRSSGTPTPDSGLPTIAESALPEQARQTLALIRSGGPYPYRQDDGVFANREGILPRQSRTYYREYTVRTPGESDRGPRRIIGGADGDLYWTADHYASFRQIQEGR